MESLCMKTPSFDNKIVSISGRLGAYCQDKRTGDLWPVEEKKLHINALELKAAKFLILAFTQNRKHLNSIDIQMDNMVAVSCLVKIEWKGGGEAKS